MKIKKTLSIGAFAVILARHGWRCFQALAEVFAKRKLRCIITAGMLLLCICTGCPNTPSVPTLINITLDTDAVKTAYTINRTTNDGPFSPTNPIYIFTNETLDLSGLVVTAFYSDGISKEVTGYVSSLEDGTELSTAGSINITISYTEGGITKSGIFTVTVTRLFTPDDIPSSQITTAAEWEAAINSIIAAGSGTADSSMYYDLTINGNISIPGTTGYTFGSLQYITVNLRGIGTLSLNADAYLFHINSNQTLIIDGDITLQGRSGNYTAVSVGENGVLILQSGTITGSTYNYGGAVHVDGYFGMFGGEISGNTSNWGGGVLVDSDGIFHMNGGIIAGNGGASGSNGGGVFVSDNGTFNMSGGEISGNTSNWGGGVLVFNDGYFNMYGGKISGNSSGYGGGVYVRQNGTFTMTGGEISGNNASDSGGGVYTWEGTINMQNGQISGNTASYDGGGFFVENGTFDMNSGEISSNTASYGGGVYIWKEGIFEMNNGQIYGNTASGSGGGVFLHDETFNFTKTGGTITGYVSDSGYGNVVRNSANTVINDKGHAVFAGANRMETTVSTNLSYSYNDGSPIWNGDWDD